MSLRQPLCPEPLISSPKIFLNFSDHILMNTLVLEAPAPCEHPAEIQIHTIGFTQKTAEQFFERLRHAGVKRVIDVRLNNRSQLAGFSKATDLPYLLKRIAGIDYVHLPELAPTREMFDAYKRHGLGWPDYEEQFLALMERRRIEAVVPRELLDGGCLLCSEDQPHHCHRRLVADYLNRKWRCVRLQHLT